MLRLIAFNDFHGNLESGQLNLELSDPLQPSQRMRVPVGGAAALAGLVQRLRQGAPHSLLVSTGDLLGASPLVSTLFKHESTVAVMNQIGLQASVVGNHEFDAGLPELLRLAKGGCAVTTPDVAVTSCAQGRYEGMHFPLLAANVRQTQDGKTPLAPYVVKRFGGIPVGIIGVVTRDTPNMVNPTAIRGLRFDDEAQAVNRSAAQLRKQGVRAIVLLAHEGGEIGTVATPADWNDSSCPQARGPIFDIAQQVSPDVDVILSAHTHKGYRCMLNGRLIIQSTSFGRGVSVVDLALNPRTRDIDRARTHSINLPVVNDATDVALRARIARTLPAPYNAVLMATRSDADIQQMVSRFSTMVAPKANRPVGQILGAFTCEDQQSDCRAGRLLADAQLAVTAAADQGGAQIVFTNAGGVRSEWPCQAPGPCLVTFGQVFAMQPFGSSLVVMTLSGAQIKAALEAQYKPDQAYPAFLQPSQGFTYTWQASAPVGDKVRDMRLNGQPIEAPVLYRVTVNSFLAEGGDGFVVFKQGSARRSGGLDIDALLDFLKPSLRDDKAAVIPMDAPRITWAP
jgi:5'-nucleotidase